MLVKAVNNTARPDGLILTLFVFDIFPKISLNNVTFIITVKKEKAIKKTIKKVAELYAKRYINKAL